MRNIADDSRASGNGHGNGHGNGNGNGNGNVLSAAIPAKGSPEPSAPIKLSAIAGILWRRLWVILLFTFLAAAGGWLFVRNVTPLYKSVAKVYVDRTGPTLVRRTDDPDMLLKTDNFRRTQAEMIKSLSVIAKIKDNPSLKASGTLDGIDNPIGYVRQGLETRVGEDDLLYISFEGKSPDTASRITNAVVEAYLDFIAEQRHSTTTEILKILEREKEKQDADFSDRLKKLTDFRMANGDIATADHGSSNPILTQLLQYSDALSRARLNLLETQALLEAAQALKDNTESMQQFLQTRNLQSQAETESAKMRRVRDQIDLTVKSLQDAQLHFTEDHPQVLLFRERLAGLYKELDNAEQDYRNAVLLAMRQQVELSKSVVTRLEALVDEQRRQVGNINSGMAQLELLQAEYTQSKQMVEILNARIKDLNIGDEAGVMNVMVLEPAVPVSEPSWPNGAKVLRIAIALGVLLGMVGALALEMMDDRLRTAEAASEATGLAVLSVVPATYKVDSEDLGTLVQKEPHSQFAEAFRTLRTAIFFGTLDGQRKSILLTSPLPGEGKSTLTANLAQALAQVGKKTVLLDCDFRRPQAHVEFGLSNEFGLSSVISGQETLAKAMHMAVCDNLDVLTCGPIPPNPSELLNSEAMRMLLADLAAKYDHIVIDSPPVLAVADARIIAATADVTLLVMRADQTRRKAARQAQEHLESVGANTLGLVINCAPRSTDRYGYGGGYGSYSYYEQTEKEAEPAESAN